MAGYGREQSPCDLDTIADLQRLTSLLAESRLLALMTLRRFCMANWVSFFQRIWGKT